MANKIALSIAGMNLMVNTDEDEAVVKKLSAAINDDLRSVIDQNPTASLINASLLCSLTYLSRYEKEARSANNLRSQIKDYLTDASRSALEAEKLSRENTDLNDEIVKLKEKITKMAANEANGNSMEESLRNQLEASRYEVNTMSKQLKEMVEQSNALQDTINSQNDLLAEKTTQINQFGDIITQQTTQLEQQSRLLEDMKHSTEAIREDRDALLDRINTINDENKALLDKAEEEKNAALKAAAVLTEEKINEVRRERGDMEALLSQQFQQIDSLKKELEDKIALSEKLSTEFASLSNELDMKKDEVDTLRSIIDTLNIELQAARTVRDSFVPSAPAADAEETVDGPVSFIEDTETESVPDPDYVEPDYSVSDYEPDYGQSEEEASVPDDEHHFEYPTYVDFTLHKDDIADNLVSDMEEETQSYTSKLQPQRPVFDAEEELVDEVIADDLGVEEGFKTFGQLIAEDHNKSKMASISEAVKNNAANKFGFDDDDMLPDLSWINDIDD